MILFGILLLFGCSDDAAVGDVFSNFTLKPTKELAAGEFLLADGTSTIDVSILLSEKSDSDRRNVIFATSSGKFTSNNSKTYTAKAEFENGELIARAVIKVSTKPGKITVTAKPEFDSPIGEFVMEQSIETALSIPASIEMQTNSLGLAGNFLSEVKVVGTLRNEHNDMVSDGFKVDFKDLLLLSNTEAGGYFREKKDTTKDSSKVQAYYSAIAYPIGTQIKIKFTVIDTDGQLTPYTDSRIITINQ